MPDASKFSPKTIPLSPTEILRAEHRQIDEQLNVLSGALRQLGDRGPAPEVLDRIESVARYIDSEMAIHHQKEEDCLFPFLATTAIWLGWSGLMRGGWWRLFLAGLTLWLGLCLATPMVGWQLYRRFPLLGELSLIHI